MISRTRFTMILVAIVLMIGMFILLSFQSNLNQSTLEVPALSPPQVRSKARFFEWMGKPHQKGKVLYLNFWASWCEPCKEELPYIQKLKKELGSQFLVLLVNLDYGESNIAEAKKMKAELAPDLESVYENAQNTKSRLQLEALPYHSFVDKKGRVAASFVAPLMQSRISFKHRAQELLAE